MIGSSSIIIILEGTKTQKLLLNEVFIRIIYWFLKVTCLMFRFAPHFGQIVFPNFNIWTSKNWFLSNLCLDSQTIVKANGEYINKLTDHRNKTYTGTQIIVCTKGCIYIQKQHFWGLGNGLQNFKIQFKSIGCCCVIPHSKGPRPYTLTVLGNCFCFIIISYIVIYVSRVFQNVKS